MDSSRLKTIGMWTLLVCLCFVVIPFHLDGEDGAGAEDEGLLQLFNNFSLRFNKSYDSKQIHLRLPHFKRSLDQITLLNYESGRRLLGAGKGGHIWKTGTQKNAGAAEWGLTQFADLSPEEFQSTYLDKSLLSRIQRRRGKKLSSVTPDQNLIMKRRRKRSAPIPDKVDYRTKDVLTEVKHQKSCGACWAFSTVETVESMAALQGHPLQPLSVQQVIDCSTEHNNGCNGGDTCTAIEWMSTRALVSEAQYPLTLKDGTCKITSALSGVHVNSNYSCAGYVGSEDKILEILANHGPVAVAVDATNWQFYVGGVIQWNCDSRVNHAVQIVGYDKTADPPYYILRNSWGSAFGDKGYLYVAIGSNLCGIALEVTSLSVK